ncbi:MAG: M48 metallopeptidase family protein [Aureispira sp.]
MSVLFDKRWGSCLLGNPSKIILNINLIKTPTYCIDYVVMHELCHLIIPNHSPAFYRLKEKYMTNWKARKKKLEGVR